MINPHFDQRRTIWKDEYSGTYQPIAYDDQFDGQWQLFLDGHPGFTRHTGVETEDAWIDDRVYDLTGHRGLVTTAATDGRNMGGRQMLDLRFAVDFFRAKRCIDIACGAGRWTRALQALGGRVMSIDVSEHGLRSVRRFNQDAHRVDLFDIAHRGDLHERFDFALAWGVCMHTHDPALAFTNAAATVRPGGGLYVMAYAPTYHNSPGVLAHREHYHRRLDTRAQRLEYVYAIAEDRANAINYMDMLSPFYNWVIEEETIHRWFQRSGFTNVVTLNGSEAEPVAYHVFGTKRGFAPPAHDDFGVRVPHVTSYDPATAQAVGGPFAHDGGFAWRVALPSLAAEADDIDAGQRSRVVLLEDGQPLWLRHTQHQDIRDRGLGTYSHWRDMLVFSSSDNSDPNGNGRTYQVAFTR